MTYKELQAQQDRVFDELDIDSGEDMPVFGRVSMSKIKSHLHSRDRAVLAWVKERLRKQVVFYENKDKELEDYCEKKGEPKLHSTNKIIAGILTDLIAEIDNALMEG